MLIQIYNSQNSNKNLKAENFPGSELLFSIAGLAEREREDRTITRKLHLGGGLTSWNPWWGERGGGGGVRRSFWRIRETDRKGKGQGKRKGKEEKRKGGE